ncbi:MAG: hypothetical protein KKH28_10135, partial [Elusimicrobia bacterium]|nr:hypothetical protein [Elusimicrobiota bacterium]
MAKEYNELEQLVNDVTNIDTARMTLRWALERLNSVEKEKAELKKNLTIAEETGKGLEIKVRSLNESVTSRSKTLDEKEDFYDKLEATMALLGEGKLDIQQLLKKEAKLDHLRKELEDEYQDKFSELDKTQSSVIARWNQRLLDVEGQYAKRLSEAQNKYDSLRSGLEADYQGRLGALEKSYQQKEKELVERIKLLETSVKSGEGRLEGRKKELEAEFIAKKNEIEENHLKLKSLLEANLDDRVRSLDGEHAVQVKSLEKSWNMERARLLEEQRIRDEHSKNAQAEIAALEAGLAAQQEKHHGELMEAINKKEEAFRAKLQEFEAEKGEYQKVMARMADEARGKDNALLADKERLQAELMAKMLEKEDAFRTKEAALEADYAARREALGAEFSAREAALNKEAAARVEFERTAWQAQSGRLEAMLAKTGEDFKRAQKEIAELSARNRQLSEQLLDKEAVFNREMVGIKANYEKELNLRVKDTVEARTAHLLEALEAAKRRNEEASALIGARDGEIDRLNAEMAGRARQFESRLMTTGNLAISEKLAELETAYKAKKERLDSETAEMKGTLDKEYQAMRAELAGNYEVISRQAALENENLKSLVMNMRKEAYETNMKAESAFNELAALTRAHQDETRKLKEDHLSELNLRTGEAVAKASEALSEKLYFAEEGMLKLQKDNMDEIRAMQDSFQKEKERLVEDLSRRESCIEAGDIKIAQLENEMTRYRQDSAVELHGRLAEREDKFKALIREDQARQEKAEHEAAQRLEAVKNSYEARLKETEDRAGETLAKATESLGEKLYLAEEGMFKLQKDNMDEIRALQDSFQKEKERLVEDLSRRESCIEAG